MEFDNESIKRWVHDLVTSDSQTALRSLYILFYPKLHPFILYYVRSEEVAEEIVSDVFLSIWEKRKQLSEIQNLKAYLYTVARNLAISHLRKEQNRKIDWNVSEIDAVHRVDLDPETEFISAEIMERLNRAIEALPSRCKQTYLLIREHNLKYKEVSEILNISIKTLEAHMSLAIRKLREALSKELKN